MDTNQIVLTPVQSINLQLLKDLKLDGFRNELCNQYETPALYEDLDFDERMKRSIEAQVEYSSNTKFHNLLRSSKIKNKIYLKQFVPSPARGLDSKVLLKLQDGDFLKKGINIIISGPTGTGKTALASATAIEAMKNGHSAMFFRMNELSTLIEAKDKVSLARFTEKLRKIKVLCIDDYGLTKISDSVVSALNEIAETRYGIGSTIITTQLKKRALKSVIDESPIRDALADRLFRDCDMEITLKGASWRGTNEELKGQI